MKEKWDGMSNEELCIEYQQTNSNELFEYFLNRNKNLIWYFTKFLVRKHPSHVDLLEQIGRQAMWDAMRKYDSERNAKFSTMFYWHVLKNLRDFYEELSDIRLPAYVREHFEEFKESHKNDNFAYNTIPLSTPTHTDSGDGTLEDALASDENIEELMDQQSTRDELIGYAKRLKPRDCACIIEYFGLQDGIPKTLQMLGNKYGVTRERIRQILSVALKKIKIWYIKDHPLN